MNYISHLAMPFRLALAILSAGSLLLAAQDEVQVADRIVALVNGEPIMLSELYSASSAEFDQVGALPTLLQNRLENRINQELLLQEIRRLKIFDVSAEEQRRYRDDLARRLGGEEALSQSLQRRGITDIEFRSLIERTLLIYEFIDYRFRRNIVIEEADLLEFYEDTFTDDFRERNSQAELPAFESVRGLIRRLLVERIVSDALEQWLTATRDRAEIIISL